MSSMWCHGCARLFDGAAGDRCPLCGVVPVVIEIGETEDQRVFRELGDAQKRARHDRRARSSGRLRTVSSRSFPAPAQPSNGPLRFAVGLAVIAVLLLVFLIRSSGPTVWTSHAGNHYHRPSCRFANGSACSRNDARMRGLFPCSYCDPDGREPSPPPTGSPSYEPPPSPAPYPVEALPDHYGLVIDGEVAARLEMWRAGIAHPTTEDVMAAEAHFAREVRAEIGAAIRERVGAMDRLAAHRSESVKSFKR